MAQDRALTDTPTIVWDFSVPGQAKAMVVGGTTGGGNIFIQATDPGGVGGINSVWIDFANMRVGVRDLTNTFWNFYDASGGIGLIGSSGYGVGPFGDVVWDETVVNSSVFTTTPSLGLLKPMYATVGWGTAINTDMDKAEALNVRLLALEAAIP